MKGGGSMAARKYKSRSGSVVMWATRPNIATTGTQQNRIAESMVREKDQKTRSHVSMTARPFALLSAISDGARKGSNRSLKYATNARKMHRRRAGISMDLGATFCFRLM